MKVVIDWDEWYPVYFPVDPGDYGVTVTATEEDVARWKRAREEFDVAQREMEALVHPDRRPA